MSLISRRKFIIFVGDKGVGKSSLIETLFPGVKVDYSEPRFFRDYKIREDLYVREIRGDPSIVDVLVHGIKMWKIEKALLIFDLSNPDTISNMNKWYSLIPFGVKILLIGNKSDLERRISDEDLNDLSRSLNTKILIVSAKTGNGLIELMEELKVREEAKKVKEEVKKEATKRVEEKAMHIDYLPIPLDSKPSLEGLSDIEVKILELVNGSKWASELAKELNLDPYTLLIFLKRLHAKGKIKDLQVIIR
ncbi:MAG: hypothetical protein DRJ38_00900 [Thermoprotei archaeon]|nr:MAG: hypothetical protein DRJ38_00900 [Thermoprotei archaeon]